VAYKVNTLLPGYTQSSIILNFAIFVSEVSFYVDKSDGKLSGHKRKRSADSESDAPSKRSKNGDTVPHQNPKVFTEEALSNLKVYNELKTEYEEEGVNQRTHQFLKRISHVKIIANQSLTKVPLMQLLSNA
jgi:hypothetical protein